MSAPPVGKIQARLETFDFAGLFTEILNWGSPQDSEWRPVPDDPTAYRAIAELGGVSALEIESEGIPEPDERKRIHRTLATTHTEHLLIFVDRNRTQSLWSWTRGSGANAKLREHAYFKGGESLEFISKLAELVVGIDELDAQGKLPLQQAAERVARAFDVSKVTKDFYKEYDQGRLDLAGRIRAAHRETGRAMTEKERGWYVSVLLNRLLFIYFLQQRGFIGGDRRYLESKLDGAPRGSFYKGFLTALFFDAFAKPDNPSEAFTGKIPYLNGGLFLPHELELDFEIDVEDAAFEKLLALFHRYNWAFLKQADDPENTISPDVLGYIFEKYINQKEFGAYYTRPEITRYLCRQTIHQLVLDKVKLATNKNYSSVAEVAFHADAKLTLQLLSDVLPSMRVIDPACGSGAFLVAAMETLYAIWHSLVGRAKGFEDDSLNGWLKKNVEGHRSERYQILKLIITRNLYGVDLMPEACEIARLRLFMALVASVDSADKLEPLPNIDFNIMAGNALVGLMRVEDKELNAQGSLFATGYPELVLRKNRLVHKFQTADSRSADPAAIREEIEALEDEARPVLDDILRERFHALGVRFEQATWDLTKAKEGKPTKQSVSTEDVEALQPFHWAFEYNEGMQAGGFDAIITNPPWQNLKPIAKEFLQDSEAAKALLGPDAVTRRGTTIKEFDEILTSCLKDEAVRSEFVAYLSQFPHQSAYFRGASQFQNQSTVIDGKRTGTDINLYKLFTEQCFNLLRPGGLCGIVIPSGIYTDLGAKGLRQMLFERAEVTGIFGFENRREIFENVHRSYKFVVLSFRKGGRTVQFPAAFMRHDVTDLERFPAELGMATSVELIKRLSPDSWSLMEFKAPIDVQIAEKMLRFPLLGERIEGTWNLRLTNEFHMTNDSHLFKTSAGPDRLPLYEGKMIWIWESGRDSPRYWIEERQGRSQQVKTDTGQALDYQAYRLGIRSVTGATNERALIVSVVPPGAFCGNSLAVSLRGAGEGRELISDSEQLAVCGVLGAFVSDWFIRMKILTNMNMFYIYQQPVPRLAASDAAFAPLVRRVAQLLCTTPEFDDLAARVGLGSHKNGATDPAERAQLRAELDGMIAHLYGLTEEEFAHILTTFPLVPKETRDAAMTEFRKIAAAKSTPTDPALQSALDLIANDEGYEVELKSSFAVPVEFDRKTWEQRGLSPQVIDQKYADDARNVVHSTLKTVAAYINTKGGTLFIGVRDDRVILGLEPDFKLLPKKPDCGGLELRIRAGLKDRLEPAPLGLVTFTPLKYEGKDFLRIDVRPDFDPHHLDGDQVFVRDGNETVQLTGPRLTRWVAKRLEERQSQTAPPTALNCNHPRRVMDGYEDGIYHVSPNRVEVRDLHRPQPGVTRGFYAPFPYRIAGPKQEDLEQARAERNVLVLGKLRHQTNLGDDGLMTYQLLQHKFAAPEPEDEACYDV